MPRPRPNHLHRERTRHGKPYWVYRNGHGPRTRIDFEYGSDEFRQAYEQAALADSKVQKTKAKKTKSLQWLYDEYTNKCHDWVNVLSKATKDQRTNIFKHVLKSAGDEAYGDITKDDIQDGIDKRIKTPSQARHFLDAMKGLFRWAKEKGHRKDDPTEGVKAPAQLDSEGFAPWTEDDETKYLARWPIGTKERVWFAVLRYTGLRRGDAVKIGRQHVKEIVSLSDKGERIVTLIAKIKTEKSKFKVEVTIPLLPSLLEVLEVGPIGDLNFICGERGNPLKKESFGNMFGEACREAGLKGKSAHGIRKFDATLAAHNEATTAQLNSMFGWKGHKMAAKYTESMDRAKLGKENFIKLEQVENNSIPEPAPNTSQPLKFSK